MKAYLYEVWKSTGNNTDIREHLVIASNTEEAEEKLSSEITDRDDYELIEELNAKVLI